MIPNHPQFDKSKKTLEGANVQMLLRKFGSPLFVFSERILKEKFRLFRSVLNDLYPCSRIAYVLSANYVPGIVRILKNEGAWVVANSEFEYWLAKKIGFEESHTVFNGLWPGLFPQAETPIFLNDFSELECLNKLAQKNGSIAKIGLTVQISHANGRIWNCHGFNLESGEVKTALHLVKGKLTYLKACGFRFNLGTNLDDPEYYLYALERLIKLIKELGHDFADNLEYLSVGGGFAVPGSRWLYKSIWPVLTIENYVGPIAQELLKSFPRPPLLIFEPGRYLVDEAGVLLSMVLYAKRIPGAHIVKEGELFLNIERDTSPEDNKAQIVYVDAGVYSVLPAANIRSFNVDVISNQYSENSEKLQTYVIGNSLRGNDFLSRDNVLPELKKEDILVFYNAGAYTLSRSAQFVHPRPAVVIVGEDGSVASLRNKESFEHISSLDIF